MKIPLENTNTKKNTPEKQLKLQKCPWKPLKLQKYTWKPLVFQKYLENHWYYKNAPLKPIKLQKYTPNTNITKIPPKNR